MAWAGFFVYSAGVLERSTGFHVGSFAHLLMLAGILRCGYDSVTYENVQYPNKVRAHLDIPANEIALAGIVLSYHSDDKVNLHRSPRSGGRGDFNDHIRRE